MININSNYFYIPPARQFDSFSHKIANVAKNIMHRRAHCNRVFIWAACNVTHSQYFKFLPVFNYRTGMAMPWRCQLFQIDTIPIIEIIDMIPILYQGFLVVSILNFNSDTSTFEPCSTVLLSLTHYRFQSGFG